MSDDFYLNQIKKCVTFIFIEEHDGSKTANGTGFFVTIKQEMDYHAVYLVTAKHVLQNTDTGYFYDQVSLRLNTTDGSVEEIVLDISKHTILTHPDPGVDLAATILYPPQDHFDYLSIPQDYFTNGTILSQKNIREGSRTFFAGLLSDFYYGKQRNYPVVRFGYISLLTEEKIEIKNYISGSPEQARFYLVECQSWGGFSGSPVFFERERVTRDGLIFRSPEIYLGGVMRGHFQDMQLLKKNVKRNVGLAFVVPCYQLEELLQSEDAKRDRKKYLK